MKGPFKRINVLIRDDQYNQVMDSKLSLSGLVRDLLDDRFSDTSIKLSVKSETKRLYDKVISNFGADDLELESYIVSALDKFLEDKVSQIEGMRQKLKRKPR